MESTTTGLMGTGKKQQGGERWQSLGGTRLYTFARWLVIVILIGISPLLSKESLWPITPQSGLVVFVIWAYIAFSLLMTLALFVPLLDPLLHWAFVFDVLFITSLALVNDERSGIFFTLYVLPLIGTALQLRSTASLLSGVITAVLYCSAYLLSLNSLGVPPLLIDYTALGLRALAIAFTP